MDGRKHSRAKKDRTLRRAFEALRVEEQLWNLVFETVWPPASRASRRKSDENTGGPFDAELDQHASHARRA